MVFQSTLPIREETPWTTRALQPAPKFQSTLPIREETRVVARVAGRRAFQSTLPIREETRARSAGRSGRRHFNPLFPYGKRPWSPPCGAGHERISIHSSHTGRDRAGIACHVARRKFQSTLPIREETKFVEAIDNNTNFNPLFPYGKRPSCKVFVKQNFYFNPLFPYGKRLPAFLKR